MLISLLFFAVISPLKNISYMVIILLFIIISAFLMILVFQYMLTLFIMYLLFMLSVIFIVVVIKSLFSIRKNLFFKWLTFSISLIIAINIFIHTMQLFGFNSSPENEFDIFDFFCYILYIIASLALIFGLPNSNFPHWPVEHRKLFVRLILSVWIFIFAFAFLRLVVPHEDIIEKLVPGKKDVWQMKEYELNKKPGILFPSL